MVKNPGKIIPWGEPPTAEELGAKEGKELGDKLLKDFKENTKRKAMAGKEDTCESCVRSKNACNKLHLGEGCGWYEPRQPDTTLVEENRKLKAALDHADASVDDLGRVTELVKAMEKIRDAKMATDAMTATDMRVTAVLALVKYEGKK